MTTFHNFDLKIETSWDKRVVNTILKTRNANDISIMYGLFILGWKIKKRYNVIRIIVKVQNLQ